MHYLNEDKRLDGWVPEHSLRPAEPNEIEQDEPRGRKRKRAGSVPPHFFSSNTAKSKANGINGADVGYSIDATLDNGADALDPYTGNDCDSDDSDVNEHRLLTAKRNFDRATFRNWSIKTWCVCLPLRKCVRAYCEP